MKIYKIVIALLFLTFNAYCQEQDTIWISNNKQQLSINTMVADLGLVNQNDKATYKFILKNLDEKSLVVWHVSSSCGCTTPSWTKKPVKQGEEATIKVKYDSKEIGVFTKSVYVYTNFDDQPIKLTLKGTVVNPKSDTNIAKHTTNFNSSLPQIQ